MQELGLQLRPLSLQQRPHPARAAGSVDQLGRLRSRRGSRDSAASPSALLAGALAGLGGSFCASSKPSGRRSRRAAAETLEELPLDELVEEAGTYVADLPAEKLKGLLEQFPEIDLKAPGLRIVSQDPPVLILEGVLSAEECRDFVESMRDRDGQFPERLGQSNLPALPSWLGAAKTALRGLPVLDWLGNPTVRWTYKSRNLLTGYLQKVHDKFGLELASGAANIKHYRRDQWLPVHIDYNRATLMTFLNDVDEGGHTLFPTLGIKVKPKKGDALVWPNQPPLKHAGDRVMKGEKWIIFYNWPAMQNWEYDDNFDFNE
eukprot:TRINITY_DN82858_c0_g1_i1.p1 TRINITY_DN82858_c0_g1~~TRINITY_DN82858_c0_g1_i1.p1  ORF type:complete len:318 (+),score=83.38 TRINITY_DN82858_c0_g1_i1:110-1063(+)